MQIKQPCVIDVSRHDPLTGEPLDPRIVGVIMKATQGKYYKDPTCGRNYTFSSGRKRGLFHFFEVDEYDGLIHLQVDNFLDVAATVGAFVDNVWLAEYEPFFDHEYIPGRDGLHGEPLQKQVKLCLDGLENRTLLIPTIYTNNRYWKYLLTNLAWTEYAPGLWDWFPTPSSRPPVWTSRYKLWMAQYPGNPDLQSAPSYLPDGWDTWWLWQYSDEGRIAGTATWTDLNVLNEAANPPNEPPQGGDMLKAYNPDRLNLRKTPGGEWITTMPANTHIEGTEIVIAADGGKWLKTTVPQAGYCASWLLEYETVPPPVVEGKLPVIQLHAEGYPDITWTPL